MKLPGYKRIITEDFDKDYQELVSKIGYSLNNYIDSLQQALNKNLTIDDNLNQNLLDIKVIVDTNGLPTIQSQLKISLKGNCRGIIVVNVKNTTNTNVYPTSTPFVSFEQVTSTLINIKHITGLIANNTYELRLLILGN